MLCNSSFTKVKTETAGFVDFDTLTISIRQETVTLLAINKPAANSAYAGEAAAKQKIDMLQEKVGETAGKIWSVLAEEGPQTQKQIKKLAKITDKEFNLGLGWLLREDKLNVEEKASDTVYSLK